LNNEIETKLFLKLYLRREVSSIQTFFFSQLDHPISRKPVLLERQL